MPPIPPNVAADQVILASWGNAVRSALNATLGRITQAGQLLVGSGTTNTTALDPPSQQSVLRASSAGAISWLAAGTLNAATWLQDRTITRTQIADGTLRNAQIGTRTITGSRLVANTVTETELDDAITDLIDVATDYRTNLKVMIGPVSTVGSLGDQAIYMSNGVRPTAYSFPHGSANGVAVYPEVFGETADIIAFAGLDEIYRFTLSTGVQLSSVTAVVGVVPTGMTRIQNVDAGAFYMVVQAANLAGFLRVFPSNLNVSLGVQDVQGIANAASLGGLWVYHRDPNPAVTFFTYAGTRTASDPSYPVGTLTGAIASTTNHFYVISTLGGSGEAFAVAYNNSDGTVDRSRSFRMLNLHLIVEGATIANGRIWLSDTFGTVLSYLLPSSDSYRADIGGTLFTIQPSFGEMYTLTATSDGTKWLRQTQLPF